MTARQTTVAALAAEKTLTDLKATRNGHRNAVEYLQQTGQPIPHPLAHELDLFERAVALKESNRG